MRLLSGPEYRKYNSIPLEEVEGGQVGRTPRVSPPLRKPTTAAAEGVFPSSGTFVPATLAFIQQRV